MQRSLALILFAIVMLGACNQGHRVNSKERPVSDLPNVRANLAFTCAYEKDAIPPRDQEADQLYHHARWMRKNNLLKQDPTVYPKIERLIRIATAYGHDKANLELRQMIGKGQADSENVMKETLDLTEELIKRGIPGGYYDMGRYLENGYGVKQDAELALKYYRKSADMGSPEGQYLIADKLAPIDVAPDIARQMQRCAAEQGHGEAALELGINLSGNQKYSEALLALQLGVKAGNSTAASFLEGGFDGPAPDDELNYIGQQKDPERVRRYKVIRKLLSDYSYLNPKVPEIDAILPLPPAKLPLWDGTLQWLKDHEANVPPPLPPEERIVDMAKAKGLDPATGRPMPQKKADAGPAAGQQPVITPATVALGTQLPSGTRCPQSGVWVCSEVNADGGNRRTFVAGQVLPEVLVPVSLSPWQKLKGEPARQIAQTAWTLESIIDSNNAI